MSDAQGGEQCIDRPESNSRTPARRVDVGRREMVGELGLDACHQTHPFADIPTRSVAHEPLEDFLDDDTGRDDEVAAQQRAPELANLGEVSWVASEGQ